jgi:transposase
MWKPEHRIAADRSGLRYPSDLTSAEWAVVEPMVPPGKHGGRKRTIDVREILNGILYVLWTGCQWQALPKDLPPKSTVWAYFDLWTGTRPSPSKPTGLGLSSRSTNLLLGELAIGRHRDEKAVRRRSRTASP